MNQSSSEKSVAQVIGDHEAIRDLLSHPLLVFLNSRELKKEWVETVIGQLYAFMQWYPAFLARLIALDLTLERKTYLSSLLYAELGEGEPQHALATILMHAAEKAGISRASVLNAKSLPATSRLLSGQRGFIASSRNGIDFTYVTERVLVPLSAGVSNAMRHLVSDSETHTLGVVRRLQAEKRIPCITKALGTVHANIHESELTHIVERSANLWKAFLSDLQQALQ